NSIASPMLHAIVALGAGRMASFEFVQGIPVSVAGRLPGGGYSGVIGGTAAAFLPDAAAKLQMKNYDWNELRYFLAIARTGSTISAAKDLGVNQSTVQRRLTALEDAVGRKLVERLPVGYRLTGFGEELRPHAEAVEAAIAGLDRKIDSTDTA